ncbi:hypothetical protein J6590_075592 [Homalodisca vitripennis]|nr:hypothetical protein J6590_075592 [Homalodisca vitripennis]
MTQRDPKSCIWALPYAPPSRMAAEEFRQPVCNKPRVPRSVTFLIRYGQCGKLSQSVLSKELWTPLPDVDSVYQVDRILSASKSSVRSEIYLWWKSIASTHLTLHTSAGASSGVIDSVRRPVISPADLIGDSHSLERFTVPQQCARTSHDVTLKTSSIKKVQTVGVEAFTIPLSLANAESGQAFVTTIVLDYHPGVGPLYIQPQWSK